MYSGPMPPGCSRLVVTTRSPGRQSMAHAPMFMPSVVAWVSAMSSTSAVRTAATAARASSMRWTATAKESTWARPVRSSYSACSAMAAAVSAGSGPTDPVLR